MRYARVTYAVIAAGATLWCVMLILPSILAVAGGEAGAPGALIYAFFRPLCHQLDDRSFHLWGVPLAVCSRCSSIYAGFLAGTFAYPFCGSLRHRFPSDRVLLVIASIPLMIDVGAGAIGLYDVTNVTRAATGAWFGIVIPLVVVPGMMEGVAQLMTRSTSRLIQPEKGLTDA
jgi:uncharacterized membrane protein